MPERQETRVSTSRKDWGVDVAAMAGSLVHEIKNPLSTINLSAQLLQEEWKDADTPKEQRALRRLQVMSSEVQRVERIIETFLRFTERHELSLEVKSLNEMLEDLAEFATAEAERSGVQIRLGLSVDLAPFSFDVDLVRQVFQNLVQNARQAMNPGGGELILKTDRVERDGVEYAIGEVIDTGPGIEADKLERVFELYYSTREGGTGYGLAISRRIIEEHGGFIEVQSVKGKGSQFSVYLPLERKET